MCLGATKPAAPIRTKFFVMDKMVNIKGAERSGVNEE